MNTFTRILPTCLLALCCFTATGQTTTIDSLKLSLARASTPQDRLDIALRICEERESMPADSLFFYANMARARATALGDKDKALLADFYRIITLQNKGLLDSCLRATEQQLKVLSPANYDVWQKFSLLKGTLLIRTNQYNDAIGQCYKVLQLAEEKGDTLMQIAAKNVIGWACMEMNSYREALTWFSRALNTGQGTEWEKWHGVVYSNMAAVYNSLKEYDTAAVYIDRALASARRWDNLSKQANALNIQADLFMLTGRNAQAEAPLKEALRMRKKIADPFYIVSDLYQLALYYARNGDPDKGIGLSQQGIALAQQYRLTSKLPILYESLAESYKAGGKLKEYAATLAQLMAIKDSVYQNNTSEALAGLQAKYEVTKQENIIISQKLALVRKNYLIYGSLLLLFCAIAVGIVLFRSYRRKQKIRLGILMEEERRAAAAAVRDAEEAERKRIAADLHDNLGAYAASIASNIDHIPSLADNNGSAVALQELRSNSREMVSQLADTIWVLKKDALSLTAISDRIKIFVQRMSASHPELNIEVVEQIAEDKLLSPVQAFHLFRMIQEAINNAVKHSKGSEIIVGIDNSNGTLNVRIEDNGRGMDASDKAKQTGNGLYNMQMRAEAGGWHIEWLKGTTSGTVVTIEQATTN